MQAQSWNLGHLGWLIGVVVLLPVGYLGKWFFDRTHVSQPTAPGAINRTPTSSGVLPGNGSTSPTADDFRDAYGSLQICYRADFLRNYVGVNVRWPGILVGSHATPGAPGYAYLHFRFEGKREDGVLFRCQVKAADYPGIQTAEEREAKAWVQGEIAGIEDACIILTNPTVEFQ